MERGACLLGLLKGGVVRVEPGAGACFNSYPTVSGRIGKVGHAVGAHALGELEHPRLHGLVRLSSGGGAAADVLAASLLGLLKGGVFRVDPIPGTEMDFLSPRRSGWIGESGDAVGAHAFGELEHLRLGIWARAGLGSGRAGK